MWTMEPVPEATIVRTSFNLSPHDRQVLCVVSLSKTATFSPRNKSIIAPIPSPLPGIIRHMPEKANKDCLAEITFGQIVALLHRGWGAFRIPLPVGAFAIRRGMTRVSREIDAAMHCPSEMRHKPVSMKPRITVLVVPVRSHFFIAC
jgi:hypothetical protein